MHILITGSPGVGKTTLAKNLSTILQYGLVNEVEFARRNELGVWDSNQKELIIPLKKIKEKLAGFLDKNKDIIIEGHLLCEMPLKVGCVIVLRLHPELLEFRLEKRGYSYEKIYDNIFCEGVDYCAKQVARNYSKTPFFEIQSQKLVNNTTNLALAVLARVGVHA